MNSPIRRLIFKWYWLLALGLIGVAVGVLSVPSIEKRWEISIAASGIAAGIIYFVQKQKLDEINLFQRLFTEFNDRYADLHRELQVIHASPDGIGLTPEQEETLDQYFNLCAEEYLFWTEGRILPCVWRSWCRGMLHYLNRPAIFQVWQQQPEPNSHYGLTMTIIRRDAE